jgi:uncharacterized protein YukJ
MPLPNYGLLTGKLVSHGAQHGGNPHYVLMVKTELVTYRVAVNMQSTLPAGDAPSSLAYQVLTNLAGRQPFSQITNENSFVLRDSTPGGLSLDFVHDGFLKMDAFTELPPGTNPQRNAFAKQLKEAADKLSNDADGFVAAFGTGYPHRDDAPPDAGRNSRRASEGFTGVDNIHMNQGSFYRIGQHIDPYYKENGVHQDGAVIFVYGDGTSVGFFSKFDTQDAETDDFGNPVHTGIAALDATAAKLSPAAKRKVLKQRVPKEDLIKAVHARRAAAPARGTAAAKNPKQLIAPGIGAQPITPVTIAGTSGGPLASGLTFGDTATIIDPNRPFDEKEKNDQYFKSAFVTNFSVHGVPEPVPSSRNGVYPVLELQQLIGKDATDAIARNRKIVFHAVGDTGAIAESQYAHEQSVAELMVKDFSIGDDAEKPAFFFHLGDVVYYYGEAEFYYDQFYHPYRAYPAPIVAIPGNHDGITHPDGAATLAGFISAFCDDKPRYWASSGGILRSTMIQPGVFFTLDAPFVSIIGLYSNCDETFGYLDNQQKLFLLSELKRLGPMRTSGEISAIILAVHHCPMSFSVSKPASATMRDDIDAACQQAGVWPDAVLSGHAHIYQRMTRVVKVGAKTWQIPHVIAGSGGYANKANQEVNKKDMQTLDFSDKEFHLHKFMMGYGYLLLTLTPGSGRTPSTLRIDFKSPDQNDGLPADGCILNLDTHQLMTQ